MPMRDEISTPHLPRFSEENHINFGWEPCEYMNKQGMGLASPDNKAPYPIPSLAEVDSYSVHPISPTPLDVSKCSIT